MRIKNWHKFQHFKDRRPPWIKLYRDLLDDVEWHDLDPVASKALVMLWLIASEDNGELPPIRVLSFRLRLPENKTKTIISQLSHWLEHDDIETISERYQGDLPETERETEVEREGETEESVGDREIKFAFDAWNEHATTLGLPLAEKLTRERRDKLRARLSDGGLQEWMRALGNLSQLPFCLGQGSRGWRANLDFLLQAKSYQKVLEMAFAEGTGPPPRKTRTQEGFEKVAAKLKAMNGNAASNTRTGIEHSPVLIGQSAARSTRPGDTARAAGSAVHGEALRLVEADSPSRDRGAA